MGEILSECNNHFPRAILLLSFLNNLVVQRLNNTTIVAMLNAPAVKSLPFNIIFHTDNVKLIG